MYIFYYTLYDHNPASVVEMSAASGKRNETHERYLLHVVDRESVIWGQLTCNLVLWQIYKAACSLAKIMILPYIAELHSFNLCV